MKVVAALALAALLARATRARAATDAAERLLRRSTTATRAAPRLRPGLSLRVWLASFGATSTVYLLHYDIEGIADGRWPLLAPWLHTYALPVFAMLSVRVALAWRCARWLHDIEDHAQRVLARARRILTAAMREVFAGFRVDADVAPRRRFGLAFESRPPPLAA